MKRSKTEAISDAYDRAHGLDSGTPKRKTKPKKKKFTDTVIKRDERELVVRGLTSLLWAERESCVRVARELYVVPDGNGGAKRFDGDWKALREWAATLPENGRPLGLATYDRLEGEVNNLIKKLENAR